MGTVGDAALDPAEAVVEGLARASAAAGEGALAREGVRAYRRVRERVDPVVLEAGEVLLAFPSVVVRPEATRECLVVVLPAATLVAWSLSRLHPTTAAVLMEKRAIVRIELASTLPGDRFVAFATVWGPFGSCTVGLPRAASVFA